MRNILTLFIVLTATPSIFSQNVQSPFSNFYKKYPQEKIYAQLDKDNYIAGETIWFKVYIQGPAGPGFQSSNVYLDLSVYDGSVIQKVRLPVYWGTSFGSIMLPDTLKSGTYMLRCYTAWMLNFKDPPIYEKRLFIYRAEDSVTKIIIPKKKNIFNFFPEGGNIVAGEFNTIAFKATDQDGYPVDVNGEVRDDSDKTVCLLKTYHDGMGKFTARLRRGIAYHAILNYADGSKETILLPGSSNVNVTLRISDPGVKKKIFIVRTRANRKDTTPVILVAQLNGKLVLEQYLYISAEESFYTIDTKDLPAGIMGITVLDSNRNPLSERLVFVNNNVTIKSSLVADTLNLKKRGKNILTFSVPDSLEGSYSVSITDASRTLVSENRNNILSRFLLSSEIKGYVHNPAYYFQNSSDSVMAALDLVLMTNGWRRYRYNEILNGIAPATRYSDKNYITIKGSVISISGQRVKYGDLNFIFKNKDDPNQFFQAVVDSAGFFKIDSVIFYGQADFLFSYTTRAGNSENVKLMVDKPSDDPSIPLKAFLPISNDASRDDVSRFESTAKSSQPISDTLLNKKFITLKEVKLKGRKNKTDLQSINDRYSKSVFSGEAKRTLDLVNNPTRVGKLRVTDLIKIYFPEVKVVTAHDVNSLDMGSNSKDKIYRDVVTNISGGAVNNRPEISVFIDEQQIGLEELRNYNSTDIAMIKYFNSFSMSPNNGPALVLYSRKGTDMGNATVNSMNKFSYDGYSYIKEFYAPDYTSATAIQKMNIDRRSTLLWNPDLLITKQNRFQKIIFYNSDVCKSIRLILEGFNSDGQLCHIEKTFE
ncbi:MAG: hypothetical protein ABJA57_07545 [Ginsengibacter sp.]